MCLPNTVSSPMVTRGFDKDFNGVIAVTPWVLCAGVKNLRFLRQVQGSNGSPTTKTAYQFAAVKTTEPGAWTVTSNTMTGDGWDTDTVDISATTDQFWVRGGLQAAGDGTNAENLSAQIRMTTDGTGRIIGARTIEVPTNGASAYNNFDLSPPVPLLGATKLMFGLDMTQQTSTTFGFWLQHKVIADNPRTGVNWSTEAGESWSDNEKVWNSGQISVTDATTSSWLQAGIRTNVTGIASVNLRAFVAAIYG